MYNYREKKVFINNMANKRQKNVQNSVYKDACDISVRMYKKYKKQITVVTYDWVGK